jgi:hypothetical protein
MKAWQKWGSAAFLLMTLVSCASWQTQFLREATNHAMQKEVIERLGAPQDTWTLATGETLWTYEHGFQTGTESGGITIVGPDLTIGRSSSCTAYVLLFDQQQVLRAWMRQPCKPTRPMASPVIDQSASPQRPR